MSASVKLTGVEEDHGLQTDVLLPLKLQLTKSRSGCQQHVENLHDALHTLSLLPTETQRKWERSQREGIKRRDEREENEGTKTERVKRKAQKQAKKEYVL